MKFIKAEKGTYGYINKKRIIEIIKTVLMFAAAIGLYLIGFVTLKTNKNLWTILAVLSVLPAAKSAVSMIMFLRFSSISADDYSKISQVMGNIPTYFEYIFTTSEKAYFVKCVSCCDKNIIVLYNMNPKKDFSAELKEHIMTAIEREGMSGYTVKIYTDFDSYIKRLSEMNEHLDGSMDKSSGRIIALFNAITL